MTSVALYIPDFSAGGAERVALNLAGALGDAGLRVTLLVNRRQGPLADAVPADVAVVDLKAQRTLAAVPGLLRFLRRERPDVLISSLSFNNMIAIWCNRLLLRPTRVVASLHNTLTRQATAMPTLRDRLVPALYRFSLPLADHIVTVSHGVAEDLRASLRRLPPISVIHNPIVSPSMLTRAQAPLDHPWFAAGQPPLLLGVGRMVAQKNFALLIDAFARLRAQRPLRLAILGDGPLRAQLAAQIDALGLGADAALLPTDPNPWRYMARAAVVALSSDYEGFGNVLVEAMATGVPVVSTNCPHGPAEILGDGKWGLLVDDATPQRLADAIARTLDDPPVDAVALRARAMAFSAAAAASAYRALVEELCGTVVTA